MAEERGLRGNRVELTVEKVGDRLVFQVDPEGLARSGSCCNCNTNALQLEQLARELTSGATKPQ